MSRTLHIAIEHVEQNKTPRLVESYCIKGILRDDWGEMCYDLGLKKSEGQNSFGTKYGAWVFEKRNDQSSYPLAGDREIFEFNVRDIEKICSYIYQINCKCRWVCDDDDENDENLHPVDKLLWQDTKEQVLNAIDFLRGLKNITYSVHSRIQQDSDEYVYLDEHNIRFVTLVE